MPLPKTLSRLDKLETYTGSWNGGSTTMTAQINSNKTNIETNRTNITQKAPFSTNVAVSHNSIWRGEKLVGPGCPYSTFEAMCVDIKAGRFNKIYIGDYFTNTFVNDSGATETVKWLVAGINYWLRSGDQDLTAQHIIVMPENTLTTLRRMNKTNTTVGGYLGSLMYSYLNCGTTGSGDTEAPKVTLSTAAMPVAGSTDGGISASNGSLLETNGSLYAKLNASSCMNGHIIKHRELISNCVNTNAVSAGYSGWNGAASSWKWVDQYIGLPSTAMVFGSNGFASSGFDNFIKAKQLPLFNLNSNLNVALRNTNNSGVGGGRASWWLSSVAFSTHFCYAYYLGDASYHHASNSSGVRPFCLIG